jgi:hypothetical protein
MMINTKKMIPFVSEPESCFVCYGLAKFISYHHVQIGSFFPEFNLHHHESYSRFHLGFSERLWQELTGAITMSRNLRRQICRNMYSIQ